MSEARILVAIACGGHVFEYWFDRDSLHTVLQQIGKAAADPDLPLTWYAAARLSQKCRQLAALAAD